MTPQQLAEQITPRVRILCHNMVPAIKDAVGTFKWIAIVTSFGITWTILTSEKVLPKIVTHSIEFGVGESKKYVIPLINALDGLINYLTSLTVFSPEQLAEVQKYYQEIKSLYSINTEQMDSAVQSALDGQLSDEGRVVLNEINFSGLS